MKTNNFIICSVSVNMCSLLCLMDNTDQELNALDNANKLGKLRFTFGTRNGYSIKK
jgi:hypothetical protein